MHRMKRAEGWLRALMEVLYWFLLLSIGLFMSAILYQLWNLSNSFEERATILVATWGVGVVLVSGIAVTMVGTTYHAVRYEASVFEGVVSRAIVGDIDVGLAKSMKSGCAMIGELISKAWNKIGGVVLMARLKGCWKMIRRSLGIMGEGSRSADNSSDNSWWRRAREAVRKALEWMKICRIKVNRNSKDELMNAYLDLIADASDPILLERAAASFSYRDWVQYGDGSVDQLRKVYSRVMATDTSFRVRETVNAQISRFSAWIPQRRKEIEENRSWRADQDRKAREGYAFYMAGSKEREEAARKEEEEQFRVIQLTEFLVSQRKDIISEYFTPTWENCSDILDLFSLPFDKFVAKCLCIHDHNINLGDHRNIFFWSVNHCIQLLRADKSDDVTRIFPHVDLFSAVRSFVRANRYYPSYYDLLKLIIGDRRTEALQTLVRFLSTPRDWYATAVASVFVIAAGSSPQFPSDLDLSTIISHISRYHSWWTWRKASDTSIAYLGQCEISSMSDPAGVHHFLHQCVHMEVPHPWAADEVWRTSPDTRNAALILLHQYEPFLTSNIALPPYPILPTSDNIVSPNRRNPELDFPLLSASDGLDEAIPSLPSYAQEDPNEPTIPPVQASHPELPSTSAALSPADDHFVDMTDTKRYYLIR
ncbi:hypothetical protein SISSUDRAFT_377976 [Sistotremastrum suecicum HHB10207 ss-3]|uniref:Uncharacterized protein n=1 Tax=Sistotremastrum suecicum HHB10207 ss-3 TaxID=1314776 RepID=A0A165Z1R4_9AGAM|nr:hypothetical protein SISSUDRAFT_377976 [Sistotremastrum suecicum HHB10207 ss-3]